MPANISGLWGSLSHWFTQVTSPWLGHAEARFNIDDKLPPPRWYMREVHGGRLWRGAEPKGASWDHWSQLQARGIRSVVSLQAEEKPESLEAAPYGIRALHVPMLDNHPPTMQQIVAVLDFVTRRENQPAYVHCRAGKGRTGVMVACYRIAVQHYSVDAAVAEARSAGMAMDTQERAIRSFAALLAQGKVRRYR